MVARTYKLEDTFLPPISAVGDYSATQYDGVRAFIVLCHAEIESYLEDFVVEILESAKSRWTAKQAAGRTATALLAYKAKTHSPPKSLVKQNPNDTLDRLICSAIDAHRKFVSRENHGVKEANVLQLLLPVGLIESDLDPIWLGGMTTFGSLRGVVAHNSAKRVKTPPDPAAARQAVADALAGLLALEAPLKSLKRA